MISNSTWLLRVRSDPVVSVLIAVPDVVVPFSELKALDDFVAPPLLRGRTSRLRLCFFGSKPRADGSKVATKAADKSARVSGCFMRF